MKDLKKYMEMFKGSYVQITINPEHLFHYVSKDMVEGIKKDGDYCFVGKIDSSDETSVDLGPVDVFRPDIKKDLGVYVNDVVEGLKKDEGKIYGYSELVKNVTDESPAGKIKEMMNESARKRNVLYSSIAKTKIL